MNRKLKICPFEDLNFNQTATNNNYQSKFTSKHVFTKKEQFKFVEYIKKCLSYQFGLTYKAFWKLAYEYANLNEKAFPEKYYIMKLAGEEWL